jgi:hypothetical protein
MATNSATNLSTAASGKLVQAQGIGVANDFTTATYPSTGGTANTVLTGDGTNFVNKPTSQVLYFVPAGGGASPADGSTYGVTSGGTGVWTSGARTKYYPPFACTVKQVTVYIDVTLTLGTGETASFNVRKNGTTDNIILNAITYTSASQSFSNTNCGIALASTDYVEFFITNPTWATNPTGVSYAIVVWIQ